MWYQNNVPCRDSPQGLLQASKLVDVKVQHGKGYPLLTNCCAIILSKQTQQQTALYPDLQNVMQAGFSTGQPPLWES